MLIYFSYEPVASRGVFFFCGYAYFTVFFFYYNLYEDFFLINSNKLILLNKKKIECTVVKSN